MVDAKTYTPQSQNPFKPGAGHMPPHLAGRIKEIEAFEKLLQQTTILENVVLTGLRGIGKTVLSERLRPIANNNGWLWTGSDLSESTSVSEQSLAIRILTDIAVVTSGITYDVENIQLAGFESNIESIEKKIDLPFLQRLYQDSPGLSSDKLKSVLEFVWLHIKKYPKVKGIVFAYDESQNMCDHSEGNQYPLSMLLDVFQSIQRKEIPFMLLLVGLPTLFPKLVETRTYAERMFSVMSLCKLTKNESKEAVVKPIEDINHPVKFDEKSVELIVGASDGYPYFIQFICREAYDVFLQKINDQDKPSVPLHEIVAKLDTDFFSGRWARATDRQKELLAIIAKVETSEKEFTSAQISEIIKVNSFVKISSSQINQMLNTLIKNGLIYKDRYGKYCFAVPLLREFISRQDVSIRNISNSDN